MAERRRKAPEPDPRVKPFLDYLAKIALKRLRENLERLERVDSRPSR